MHRIDKARRKGSKIAGVDTLTLDKERGLVRPARDNLMPSGVTSPDYFDQVAEPERLTFDDLKTLASRALLSH